MRLRTVHGMACFPLVVDSHSFRHEVLWADAARDATDMRANQEGTEEVFDIVVTSDDSVK